MIRNFLWDLPHKTKSYYARMFEWNLMWSFFRWKLDTINEMAAIWAKGFAYEQAFEFIWCYLFSCVECNFPYFHCFRIQNYLKYSNSYSYTVVVDLDLGGHNWNSINILIYASRDICKISYHGWKFTSSVLVFFEKMNFLVFLNFLLRGKIKNSRQAPHTTSVLIRVWHNRPGTAVNDW